MKHFGKTLALAGALLTFGAMTQSAQAQRGNFDPAQMRQQMMDNYREQFEVKEDAEWAIIAERITKVMDAQTATRAFAGMGGRGGRGGRGGPGGQGGAGGQGGGQGGPGGNRGGFGGEPNLDVEALRKAIEDKAPADQIKGLVAKVRNARKTADAKLEAAQGDLKQVLSVRQEAIAMMSGLVK